MITRNYQHIRLLLQYSGYDGVHLLNLFYLRIEVSIFASAVRVLVMHEEKIMSSPNLTESFKLVLKVGEALDEGHTHEARQPFIHRVNRQRRCVELEYVLKAWQTRLRRPTPQRDHVGRVLIPDTFPDLFHPLIDQIGSAAGSV